MSKTIRGTAYIMIAMLIFMISGYIVNIVLGRKLGPELYGVYGVLTSIMTALNIMQVSGVPQVLSRQASKQPEQAAVAFRSAIRAQLYVGMILMTLFILLSPLAAYSFGDKNFIGYMLAMSLIFPGYGLYALCAAYYNGLHQFRSQSLINISYSIAKLFLVLLLVMIFSSGLYGVIAGFVIAPIVALLIAFRLPSVGVLESRANTRELMTQSAPLVLFAVISTLQLSIDLFAVKAAIPSDEFAGYYAVAQSIGLIAFLSISALGQVVFPQIASLADSNNHAKAEVLIANSYRYFFVLLLPVCALLLGASKPLVVGLFGAEYAPAIGPLRILIVAYVALALFALASNILNGLNLAKFSVRYSVVGLTISVIGFVVLLPRYGMDGAALATAFGGIVSGWFAIAKIGGMFGVYPDIWYVMRVSLAASIVVIIQLLSQPTFWQLAILWPLCGILYLTTLYLFKIINSKDVHQFKVLKQRYVK